MPRKGNGILFEVHPAPLKDKAGNHFVYVRPLGLQKLSMKELDGYCTKNYAIHPGEMSQALSVFMRQLQL